MAIIKAQDTGKLYEIFTGEQDVTIDLMGDNYILPNRDEQLDGIDAVIETTEDVIWWAQYCAVAETIDNQLQEIGATSTHPAYEALDTVDLEDGQRAACKILGIDYTQICEGIDIAEYEC